MGFEPSGYRLKVSSDYGVTHPAGVVSAWLGTDGYGNSASQATLGKRPDFLTASINGLDAIEFTGGTQALTLAHNTLTDNLFNGGGTVVVVLGVDTAGGGTAGRLIEKLNGSSAASWNLVTITASGGYYQMLFNQVTSGTQGAFRTNSVLLLTEPQIFTITYDSATPTIPPVMRVIGTEVITVTTTAPTGTAVNDSGGDFTIGNRVAGDRGLDGRFGSIYMWNRVLTDYEIGNLEMFLATKWDITLYDNPTKKYGAREYIITVPPAGARPLILCLHGGGGDGITFVIQLQLGPLLGDEAVLVFPTATYNNAVDSGRTWNSGGIQTFNQAPDSTYLKNLVDFITAQVAEQGVNVSDVYIVGHSNGGMMGYRLLIDHPEMFAGLFAISADVMVTNPNIYTGNIKHIHGQDDANVPLAGGVGIGGVYYTPVVETIQEFTHVNSGTGVTSGSSLADDFTILPSPAAHTMSSLANVLASSPYSTTFAQQIYNFVIG